MRDGSTRRDHPAGRWLFAGLLLTSLISLAPASAQVAVVRGARLATTGPVAARNVAAAVARVERCLSAVGVASARIDDDRLSPEALSPFRALVFPLNRLEAADVPVLAALAARGGGVIVFAPDGPPDLYTLLGIRESSRSQPSGPVDGIHLDPGVPPVTPGLPEWLPLPHRSPRSLATLNGTQVLGRWSTTGSEPVPGGVAVTSGPAGVSVAELLQDGELLARGWFLRALLGRWDPALAAGTLPAMRQQALETLASVAREAAREVNGPGRNAARALQLSRDLREERSRATALLRASPPPHEDSPALHAAVREAQEAVIRLRRLRFRLTPAAPGELRAVWIHTYAPTDWDIVMGKLAARGFNAIFVRVGRGGNVIYPSALLPRDAWAQGSGDELQRAIDAARRHGLAFHAWRVNYDLRTAPRDYLERMAAEDRIVRDSEGRQGISANPADPRNAELELKAMLEVVERYDVDGVQFDYIRYPDEPSYDFDYGPVSRREFERETGRPVENWPADVRSGARKQEYDEWEIRQVDRLVERVSQAVRAKKPWVQISAAVWRNHRRYRSIIKQDWLRWVERGWLDFVVPMNYTAEPETFAETIRAQTAAVRGRVPVMAGIGNWLLQTPEALIDQVTAARDAGAAGFVLFAYNAEQIDEHLEALSLGATATPARPALPAPALRLELPEAVPQSDAPHTIAAGRPATVTLRLAPDIPLPPVFSGEVRLERPDGTLLTVLGPVSRARALPVTWRVSAPEGRWRPVARGVARDGRGRLRNVVAPGPIAEGVRAAAGIRSPRATPQGVGPPPRGPLEEPSGQPRADRTVAERGARPPEW
jgi:uncharacterized lipoprotein YddW (UPF0748 family)